MSKEYPLAIDNLSNEFINNVDKVCTVMECNCLYVSADRLRQLVRAVRADRARVQKDDTLAIDGLSGRTIVEAEYEGEAATKIVVAAVNKDRARNRAKHAAGGDIPPPDPAMVEACLRDAKAGKGSTIDEILEHAAGGDAHVSAIQSESANAPPVAACDRAGPILRPIATMAGAEWNILDASGSRIAWCGYDNNHITSGPPIAREIVRLIEAVHAPDTLDEDLEDGPVTACAKKYGLEAVERATGYKFNQTADKKSSLKEVAAEHGIDLSRVKEQQAELDVLTGKRTCETDEPVDDAVPAPDAARSCAPPDDTPGPYEWPVVPTLSRTPEEDFEVCEMAAEADEAEPWKQQFHDNAKCGACGGPLEVERDVVCLRCVCHAGISGMESEHARMVKERDTWRAEAVRLRDECDRMEERLELSARDVDSLREKSAHEVIVAEKAMTSYANAQAEIDKLRAELSHESKRVLKLEAVASNQRESCDELVGECESLLEELATANTQIELLKSDVEDGKHYLQQAREELAARPDTLAECQKLLYELGPGWHVTIYHDGVCSIDQSGNPEALVRVEALTAKLAEFTSRKPAEPTLRESIDTIANLLTEMHATPAVRECWKTIAAALATQKVKP